MTMTTHHRSFKNLGFGSTRWSRKATLRDEKLHALSNTPLFAGLTGTHLEMAGRITDRVTVKSGTRLMVQGRIATHMSIIINGSATVSIDGTDIRVLGPGDIIGELSMVDVEPASATVVTTDDCTIWHIARAGFLPLWQQHPEMAIPMLQATVARLRNVSRPPAVPQQRP